MRFHVLGSSSSGNCSVLQSNEATILIDAGFTCRKIDQMLREHGLSIKDIDAAFITHEHSDHTAGIRGLARTKKPIYATYGTSECVQRNLTSQVNWQIFESGSNFHFRDLEIETFRIPHDAYDPVGYVFTSGGDDLFNPRKSIAWATDLGYMPANVSQQIKQADLLVLESNYDSQMLDQSDRPWQLKQRIRGKHGHLSNEAALEYLQTTKGRWHTVVLAHLSKDCNDHEKVQKNFDTHLTNAGFKIHTVNPYNGGLHNLVV
jgi:phosphoribosyl 1,2-cyclic phosphodiesterase